MVDRAAALAATTLLFESYRNQYRRDVHGRQEAMRKPLSRARLTRAARHFHVQRHTAMPMETRGLLAEWDEAAGRLTVYGAAKLPFFNRRSWPR